LAFFQFGNYFSPWADICLSVLTLDGGDVSHVQVRLGLMAMLVGVAQVAVDLTIGTFGAELQVTK
jgi:hypothetical protein